jgi:hypothetical protein
MLMTTVSSSDKDAFQGTSGAISVDQGRAVRYAQEPEITGFFSRVTTVLPLLGLAGDHTGTFSGSEELFGDRAQVQGPLKWQDRHIIRG